jgi:hypothetical protein
MRLTIYLDDKPRRGAREVGRILPDPMLPPEPDSHSFASQF